MNRIKYSNHIYKLITVHRYSTLPRIKTENVAEHSFFVAAILLSLWDEYEFDLGVALQAAISHDILEADFTDVIHPIKVKYPDIAIALVEAERCEIQKYPLATQHGYFIFCNDSVEGLVANYADVLQILQYVESEEKLGNTAVSDVRLEARQRAATLRDRMKPYARDKRDS